MYIIPFNPSLLCDKDTPERRCHSFVKDGKIQYLKDCWHKLAGQTVDLPDFEEETMIDENDQMPHEDDEQSPEVAPVANTAAPVEQPSPYADGDPFEAAEEAAHKADAAALTAALAAFAEQRKAGGAGDKSEVETKTEEPVKPAKQKTFPRRVWHKKGQYGARLVASQVEIRALGNEWTDEAPAPKHPQ